VRSTVYAVSGRADLVDDVSQQVWAQAWERLGSLRDPQCLRPWLYNIARNATIDACVARGRGRAVSIEDGIEPPAEGEHVSPVGAAIASESRSELLSAVRALPAIYREPFVLRHLEDWSYARIGEVLGLSVETVETRLVRARRLLREMLRGKVE
jgi:RNA polymerase sigma-70 factor (ECF subfamily)